VVFRNILVAVDGSPHANEALAQAIDLSECANANLTLFTAVEQPPAFGYLGLGASGSATFVELAGTEAERLSWQARERVPDQVPVACVVTRHPVEPALVRQIIRGEHDLVVMGSRGRGPIRSAALGSVSRHVLQHSPVPVLIVHAERGEAAGKRSRRHSREVRR
jgi:nucleotide-binding universal stress UspA family protein